MRIDFIADTNILIYVHEGNKVIEPFLEYNFGISFAYNIPLVSADKGLLKVEELDLILIEF